MFRRMIGVASIAATAVVLGGTPANAHTGCARDYFCAYNGYSYSSELTRFNPRVGTEYGVSNNTTSSVANHNAGVSVCGVEAEGWPDHTVLRVGPTQHIAQLGSNSNNQIDHWYGC